MKKILYIDNRAYGHNADLHVDFIRYMNDNKYYNIFGYGNYMKKYFQNNLVPSKNISKDFSVILKKFKPDIMLTYNRNGSSYEVGLDNINLYSWLSEEIYKLDIPKFHITTDYCRSGFRKSQADWFDDLGYTAALFRHKVSTKYPLNIDKYWFPFSVNSKLYSMNINKNISKKEKKVSFLGAAHNSAKSLYSNRIAAIDYLMNKKILKISKVTNKKTFDREILLGDKYIKFITSSMFGLTCGGTCDYMTAKYFQIPAAYSMLICTETDGLDLFPKDTYIIYNKDNLESMYSEILFHLKNKNIYKNKIDTLHNYVIKNHNHDKRISFFINIINKYI